MGEKGEVPRSVSARCARAGASLTGYAGRDLGASMTSFANDFGGRVVVTGYPPRSQGHHLAALSATLVPLRSRKPLFDRRDPEGAESG